MNIKKFIQDDEGVSPVIGVILMVAITVILAAVIAAFVLGLGDSGQDTPQASFDFDINQNPSTTDTSIELTVTAQSGDTIDATQVTFEGDGIAGGGAFDADNTWDSVGDSEITAGSSVTLGDDTTSSDGELAQNGDGTVNVVWSSPDGEDSSILASVDLPDTS